MLHPIVKKCFAPPVNYVKCSFEQLIHWKCLARLNIFHSFNAVIFSSEALKRQTCFHDLLRFQRELQSHQVAEPLESINTLKLFLKVSGTVNISLASAGSNSPCA